MYGNQNPVVYVDYTGGKVYGVGGGASGGLAVYSGLQGFYVWDDKGNKGFIVVVGFGGGFGIGGEIQMAPENTGVGISGSKVGLDFHGIGTYTWLIKF